jgi:hypothetical protein
MVENMDLEQSHLAMVLKYKPTGIKPMCKDKEKFFILMEIFSMVNITCLKNMEKAFRFGVLTIPNMKVNLKKIHYKDKLKYILHQASIILEELETVKEMDKELILIKMVICLTDNGRMI